MCMMRRREPVPHSVWFRIQVFSIEPCSLCANSFFFYCVCFFFLLCSGTIIALSVQWFAAHISVFCRTIIIYEETRATIKTWKTKQKNDAAGPNRNGKLENINRRWFHDEVILLWCMHKCVWMVQGTHMCTNNITKRSNRRFILHSNSPKSCELCALIDCRILWRALSSATNTHTQANNVNSSNSV